jgi:hypothetical protein
MTHHYKPNLHELGQLRNITDDLIFLNEELKGYLPCYAHEIFKLKIEEHKLLYRERTGRPYKSWEELREGIDGFA